jgi:hypothetical protein
MHGITDSTIISAVGYNDSTNTLRVILINGRMYDYKAVPLAVANRLITAPSKGSFFNDRIRNTYIYHEVTPIDV